MRRFVEQATQAPDDPALAAPCGVVSYGELHAMALSVATRLEELEIRPGERVAVWGRKSTDTIALVLGCMLSGRPVLVAAPDLRAEIVGELLQHAGTSRVLATRSLDGAVVVDPGVPPAAPASRVTRDPDPRDVALLLTTSGSTGLPKLVPLSHGSIERFTSWASDRFDIEPGTTVLSHCGLNFDLSILEVWTTLMHGACAVLVAHDRSTQGEHLLDLITAHEVSVVQGVPMLYGLLLDAAGPAQALHRVRHAIVTGDTAPASVLAGLPTLLPGARLYSVYGCTETNDSFIHEIEPGRVEAIPLGDPLPGVSALVVADDGAVRTGAGRGELWVSTPFQTSGYLGPRSSGNDFSAGPLGEPERVYFRTSDMVRRDPVGAMFLEGRNDSHVKVRGSRVNLQEIEQALLEHPGVAEAAVVTFDDRLAGRRLHAVVRKRRDMELDALALRTRCARRLTRVAIPSIIEIQDEPLPKTTTGKVDRAAVERCARAGNHGYDHRGHAVHR